MGENDPNTVIVTFDDDVIYPDTLLVEMLKRHTIHPDAAIGSSGLQIGHFPFYGGVTYNEWSDKYLFTCKQKDKAKSTDILFGYSGVLYVRKFFPPGSDEGYSYKQSPKPVTSSRPLAEFFNYAFVDKDLYRNDDVLISCYLNNRGIKRLLYKLPFVKKTNKNKDGISASLTTFLPSLYKAINVCDQDLGWIKTRCNATAQQTYGFWVLLFILVIVWFLLGYGVTRL
jgi:hypothetical protein